MALQGTNYTITYCIKDSDFDLANATDIHFTVRQGTNIIDKTGSDIAIDTIALTISTTLTQAESLSLTQGFAEVQINGMLDGSRWATDALKYAILENLLKKEI